MASESSQSIIFEYTDGTESAPIPQEYAAEIRRVCGDSHLLTEDGIPHCPGASKPGDAREMESGGDSYASQPTQNQGLEPFQLSIPWLPLGILAALVFAFVLLSPQKK
jgi:hypothetical protein